MVARQLDGGNGGDDLRGGGASLGVGGTESLQSQLLDSVLGFVVSLLQPFRLELLMTSEISGCECVLEGDTGGGSDGPISGVIC